MGILDGVVEWISEQIMYGLDLINTSVLSALGCGMDTFLRYFPAAETMYDIFTAIGIGLIYINQHLVYTMGKVPGGIITAVFCISGQ